MLGKENDGRQRREEPPPFPRLPPVEESAFSENLANLMKRNPVPSVLVGIGIGFFLARVTRK